MDKLCIQMDTLPECLKWHYKSQNILKTEISISSQVFVFKQNGKSDQDLDGIEVA